jgi:nitroimidazol reductase NimA-like FMN-containing flavoprotein (pyridoxamine 5'-phosphate oxidase superfamily)
MSSCEHPFSELTEEQCLTLLAGTDIGRVGISVSALPEVHLVRFRLTAGAIVFHTRPGSPLDRALRDAVVAFEAGQPALDDRRGWTVQVQGRANHVDDPTAYPLLERPPERLVQLAIDRVSGRWLMPGAAQDQRPGGPGR